MTYVNVNLSWFKMSQLELMKKQKGSLSAKAGGKGMTNHSIFTTQKWEKRFICDTRGDTSSSLVKRRRFNFFSIANDVA